MPVSRQSFPCFRSNALIELTHSIAGITFRTQSNARLPLLQDPPFTNYSRSDQVRPDVYQRIWKMTSDSDLTGPMMDETRRLLANHATCAEGALDSPLLRAVKVQARLEACLHDLSKLHIGLKPDEVVIRDFSSQEIDVFYTETLGGYSQVKETYLPEAYVASNFRQIFASFLPYFSAIMVHSSGVVRHNLAALFFAPDGGGKTTVVRHCNGNAILNDDQIILARDRKQIHAHATPLGAMTDGPCHAKIGAFFLLEWAPRFELTPLKPSDAIQCLWRENLNHVFFLPRHLKVQAFEILCDACQQVPVFRMRFSPDYIDWQAIDAILKTNAAKSAI